MKNSCNCGGCGVRGGGGCCCGCGTLVVFVATILIFTTGHADGFRAEKDFSKKINAAGTHFYFLFLYQFFEIPVPYSPDRSSRGKYTRFRCFT